jgi:hypothetical protein
VFLIFVEFFINFPTPLSSLQSDTGAESYDQNIEMHEESKSLKFSPDWVLPFYLDIIGLGSCKLGPAFPQWLQTPKKKKKIIA